MIGAVTHSLFLNRVTIHWFDAVFVGVLVVGFVHGRKNGMTREFLPLIQWLLIFILGGLLYRPVGRLIANLTGLNLLMSYVSGYIILAVVVFIVFSQIKQRLRATLDEGSLFGNAEYYLGMPAGVVRSVCMLLVALAFLNARQYTNSEINASNNYQQRWYGAHYFPDLYNVQHQVFRESFVGRGIRKCVGGLLIHPTLLHGAQTEQGQQGQEPVSPP